MTASPSYSLALPRSFTLPIYPLMHFSNKQEKVDDEMEAKDRWMRGGYEATANSVEHDTILMSSRI